MLDESFIDINVRLPWTTLGSLGRRNRGMKDPAPVRSQSTSKTESAMSGTSSVQNTTTPENAIQQMEAAFNRAIVKSAEITTKTTEKKVSLDAAKQRPNA
jgi:hypothetical protein